MSDEEFLSGLTGSDSDLRLAIEALRGAGQSFCLIGGLAVNHYAEPVVTLDAHFAVVTGAGIAEALQARGFRVQTFANSINAQLPGSRLRLQVTINSRYGTFHPALSLATCLAWHPGGGFGRSRSRQALGFAGCKPARIQTCQRPGRSHSPLRVAWASRRAHPAGIDSRS